MNGESVDVDWDQRVAALWARINELEEEEFLSAHALLVDELPVGSSVATFERAASHDSFGRPDLAIPLYLEAIAAGVPGERRRRAAIQMASSHRNMGDPAKAVELLRPELDLPADHLTGAVRTFLALALNDLGRPTEAVAVAITALSEYLPRYNRSVARFAGEIDAGLERDFWPPTIPELLVTDFAKSLTFYTDTLGFDTLYTRGAPGFAMLRLGRVQLMLEQLATDVWLTGPMEHPYGRGINIEMEHPDPESLSINLVAKGIELYRPLFAVTRDLANGATASSVEFLVQDPDGYLLRFVTPA
jgi:catechol 2,3-dioxygenase-like lactoylglutathione lyase family enzyme